MRTHESTIPFQARPWEEIFAFLSEMTSRHPQGTTSMHDILVVTAPPPDPPCDLIAVRAPGSLREPSPGHVIIEHRSCTGHNDLIERPVADAVPLFWRFVITKYGIYPGTPATPRPGVAPSQ